MIQRKIHIGWAFNIEPAVFSFRSEILAITWQPIEISKRNEHEEKEKCKTKKKEKKNNHRNNKH